MPLLKWVAAGALSAATTVVAGTAAGTLRSATAAAAGTVAVAGSAAGTLGPVAGSASGSVTAAVSGTAAGTLSRIAGSASGSVTATGVAAGPLRRVTASAAGSVTAAGTGAGILRSVAGSAAGIVRNPGTVAGTLRSVTASAAGSVRTTGTAAGTLSRITGAASGSVTVIIQGSADATLSRIAAAALGTVTGAEGTAVGTLRAVTADASGSVTSTGIAAADLAPIVAAASGSVASTAAGTLSRITAHATGIIPTQGAAAGILHAITAQAAGTVTTRGTAAGTLAPITADASGSTDATGTAAGTLSRITATGTAERTGEEGTGVGPLRPITCAAAGTVSAEGTGAGQLRPIVASAAGVTILGDPGTGAGTLRPIVASAAAPPLAANFLKALTDYLEAHPDLLALLDDEPRVHVERAGTNSVAPYVLVEGVRLAPDDDVLGSEVVTLEVNAYAPTAAAARHLGAAIVAAIDPPSLNDDSTRAGRLEWDGGEEDLALHTGGRLFRIPGGAFGTRANWAKTAEYEFRIRDDEGARVTPDAPYAPAELPESLPQAVAGYLIAADALTTLLGGEGKVYLDLTTASGSTRPFVLIEHPEDDPDGEADEEEIVRLAVVAQARTLRAATAVHRLLRDLLNPPGMSPRGRRSAPFAWEGGIEQCALWMGSTLSLEDGVGPAGADVWAWSAEYEFRVHRT